MIPRHKVFHTLLFIVAINFLFGCPIANTFTENKAQLSCSVASQTELKKKYCQAHFKQDHSPSPVLNSAQNLFSASTSNRPCMRAALALVSSSAPFKTSMRLNL
jgi:hypothetical protein